MSTKEALKPKIGASKKDEKRKAKKEKLNQELAAKEEAKEEMRRQEEEERMASLRQEEERIQDSFRGPATMGNKFAELISQITEQNAQKQASDPRRSNKKKASDAIKKAKFLLKSDEFQMDPISAMGSVTYGLQQKLEQNQNDA